MAQAKERHFYLGNTNLPTPQASFDYEQHPEWVADLEKCRKNILYFAENFFFIINLDKGRQKIELHDYQKRILRALRDNRFVIVLSSRQSGKTTLMTIFALWMACFFEDQRILIVANKEKTAINIFKRIRLAYEQLPNYLKPGTIKYGETGVEMGNGSSIGISTTSSDAGRGDSCNCLILDELAFIDNNLAREFWKSVYPIISASKKSKIFVASTPNGTDNLFHELYDGAIKKENDWIAERVDWWEVPGRDENWKKKTMRTIGSKEIFDQEFGNVFHQSGESAVNDSLFEKLKADVSEPQYIFEDGKYLLWDSYKKGNLYAIGVDVSEGVGENASCIQVLDITDLTQIQQVAVYNNSVISPLQFVPKCHEIFQHWGNPPVLIERNNCGGQVVDLLKNDLNYPNIISYGPTVAGSSYNRAGVLAHTNTKYKGVINMRYYINDLNAVRIRDLKTLQELKGFVRYPNGTWAARAGGHNLDDRVMSLVWALMILENEIAEKYYDVEYDDSRRPLKLKALDYGLGKFFVDPTKLLLNLKDPSAGDIMPTFIRPDANQDTYYDDDLEFLQKGGWKALNSNI
tara:strand:+ start:516 stop:2240 length:1725 start_codon:yes stop_codon:yes gene_type:complete